MTPILSLPTGLRSQHKACSRLKTAAGKCRNAGHISYTTGYQTVVSVSLLVRQPLYTWHVALIKKLKKKCI